MAIDVNSGDVGEHAMTLRDSKAIEKLAKEEPSIFTRIKDVITGIVNDIKRAFEGIKGNTFEYKRMEELLDDWSGIQKLWDDAFVDMSRNTNRAEKAAVTEGGKGSADAMFDSRNISAPFFKDMETNGSSIYNNKELYTYEHLTSMPDMKVVRIADYKEVRKNGKIERNDILNMGMKNALKNGNGLSNGEVAVSNVYTGRKLKISTQSIRHSLEGNYHRLLTNSRIAAKIGNVVHNAIPVNVLKNKADVDGTYIMASYLAGEDVSAVAMITVEAKTNDITKIDIYDNIHAVSGRTIKEGASTHHDNQKHGGTVRDESLATAEAPSNITIAELLEKVKQTHASVPSDDVKGRLGMDNINGTYTGSTVFSLRNQSNQQDEETANSFRDNRSNREILVNALESTTRNETEKRILEDYKQIAGTLDMLEKLKGEKQNAMRDAQTAEERGGYEEDIRNIDDKIAYHDAKITGA